MLERFEVHGFKSLQKVAVNLSPLVIVFGPNAAGKSNLLEALVLLSRCVGERTFADAFEAGVRGYPLESFSLPAGGLETLLATEKANLRLEARMRLQNEDRLHYAIELSIKPFTGELLLEDELLARKTAHGKPKGNPAVERVTGPAGHRIRIRRKAGPNHPLEETPGRLGHSLVSNRQFTGSARYPDFDALRAEVGSLQVVYLDPREAMRQAQPPREVDDIGDRGQYLVPFLHRLSTQRPKDFKAVVRTARSVIPTIEDVTTELVGARGEIDLKVKLDGRWMTARVLSEGTLRVLALCAMAVSPYTSGMLAFEEPENGVHPRRIEIVARLLASAATRRQVVVTTHSPLVVGEIVRMLRRGEIAPGSVSLLRCSAGPDGTLVRPFNTDGPLFADDQVSRALAASEDDQVIQDLMVRGWLDG